VYGDPNDQNSIAHLIKNSQVSGFNTAFLSYGLSGSGKTWTVLGNIQDLLKNETNYTQGITQLALKNLFEEEMKVEMAAF